MYARVSFTVAMPAGVPRVPDDGLVFRDGKVFVPIVRANRLRLAEVTLGYNDGQLVAIDVGQAARDGAPVQPILRRPGA
ncbi:MAG TPA: hypothetical protein VNE82_21885 [Candidatus Binataceae bacterium]|nr:hypothetical protein [Candidatus Binataceae bacterium]HVB82586.1 hypothetical protein [Candidatus Binataceae bacterium]